MSVIKPTPPVVDADQRRAVRRELAADAEHRAVAAEHHGDVGARADLRGTQGRVIGHADLRGGVRFEHHVEAALRDARGERGQRLADAWRIVAPDERDGLELAGNLHAGITP